MLASVYGWFTGGFDKPILKDAKGDARFPCVTVVRRDARSRARELLSSPNSGTHDDRAVILAAEDASVWHHLRRLKVENRCGDTLSAQAEQFHAALVCRIEGADSDDDIDQA
jgi:hypothetical protein